MQAQEPEKQLSICWSEQPVRGERKGQELFFSHASLYLVDETYDTPYIAQQLHVHNWQGFNFIPNIWVGKERDNPLGPSTITPVVSKDEAVMWGAWNHMMKQALSWREDGESGDLMFDDNFHEDEEAHNCRKAAKYLLRSIGVKIDPDLVQSPAGMSGEPLPVTSVFSLNAPPLKTLDALYAENMRLVDALIPPWKMSKAPVYPGLEDVN